MQVPYRSAKSLDDPVRTGAGFGCAIVAKLPSLRVVGRTDTLDEIIQIVRDVMADRLPAGIAIERDTEFEAVGVDSFEAIQIVSAVQDSFDVLIDPADAEDALTIGELDDIVKRLFRQLEEPSSDP